MSSTCNPLLLCRMGIKYLWTYLKDHQDKVFRKIDLAEEARQQGATAESRAKLLCDYGAVVRRLETAILKERHPKYCSYYGCDTRVLGKQMEGFIEALRSIHIEPVFVSDGPPGADKEGFKAKYEEMKRRQCYRRLESAEWEKEVIRPGGNPPEINIPNPRCYVVCNEVLRKHGVTNMVTHCEADALLMHYCRNCPEPWPLGILSSDTDFAVAESKCKFLPLDFFDWDHIMGFHKGAIKNAIKSLHCQFTNRQHLAKFLSLSEQDLTMFAVLCGNDYTAHIAREIREKSWKLAANQLNDPQEVVKWLNSNQPYEGIVEGYEETYEGFRDAYKHSTEFYSGTEPIGKEQPTNVSSPENLSPTFLSIKNGIFVQPVVAEVQPVRGRRPLVLPYKVSQPIHEIIYALCGYGRVSEYGFRSSGNFGEIPVADIMDLSNIQRSLRQRSFPTRAVALHHLVSTPLHSLAKIGHCGLEKFAPADRLPAEPEQKVLRGIITVSTLIHFFAQMELEDDDVHKKRYEHVCWPLLPLLLAFQVIWMLANLIQIISSEQCHCLPPSRSHCWQSTTSLSSLAWLLKHQTFSAAVSLCQRTWP